MSPSSRWVPVAFGSEASPVRRASEVPIHPFVLSNTSIETAHPSGRFDPLWTTLPTGADQFLYFGRPRPSAGRVEPPRRVGLAALFQQSRGLQRSWRAAPMAWSQSW